MPKAAPKYRQIENYLYSLLSVGELRSGDQIPTEEELCEKFGFSRMTVNKALTNLSNKGLIVRVAGRGSFVSGRHIDKDINSGKSFTEDMLESGIDPQTQLISYEVVSASEANHVLSKLKVEKTDLLHHFVRLRTADGVPIAINDTYIPVSIIPAIDINSLNASLYDYIRSLGLEIKIYKIAMSASMPTDEQKKLLQADNIALLRSSHVSFTVIDNVEKPFEYTVTSYNGGMYTYNYYLD